jgi:hypothetical protein
VPFYILSNTEIKNDKSPRINKSLFLGVIGKRAGAEKTAGEPPHKKKFSSVVKDKLLLSSKNLGEIIHSVGK